MRKTLIVIGVLGTIGLTSAPGHAAKRDANEREAQERAAKRSCLNGDTSKGVQILTDLYIQSNDPTYLFNQGRCYEQNNRYEDAIGRFREYLRKINVSDDADTADAKQAKKHIADCEALLGKKEAEPVAAPVAATVTVPVATPAPEPAPVVQQPVAVLPQPQPAAEASPSCTLCKVGIATAAVGGAGLIAGLVLNLKANSTIGDAESHYSNATYSSAKDYKTMSAISYGAGAGLVVVGAVLYVLGNTSGATSSSVAFVPTASTSHAGIAMQGAF